MENNPGPSSFVLGAVSLSGRATPSDIIQKAMLSGFSSREARNALKKLVDGGALEYVCENATVYAVPSFAAPVRVGRRLFLCRPGMEYPLPFEGAIPVILREGASFGSGRHPTTRLCLGLLEGAMDAMPEDLRENALDVGTGSGVLAVAAVKLGIKRAIGLDREPDAIAEARNNAALNGVFDRIVISGGDAGAVSGGFGLILANLRAPTLVSLAGFFSEKLHKGGFLVVSGLHPEEADNYEAKAQTAGLRLSERRDEGAWSGLSFQKSTG